MDEHVLVMVLTVLLLCINVDAPSTGSRLSDVRMVEESQSMKDACKIMLDPLTKTGRVRTGFGTSLLEEARAAGRGEREWRLCGSCHRHFVTVFGLYRDSDDAADRKSVFC